MEKKRKAAYNRKNALAAEPEWSELQKNIFDVYENGTNNIIISALAGSGKTSMLSGMINRTESTVKVSMVAFNVHIATELKRRVPTRISVTTANGLGYSVLCRYFSGDKISMDEQKYKKIAREKIGKMGLDSDKQIVATNFMAKVGAFVRQSLCELDDRAIKKMISFYAIEYPEKLDTPTIDKLVSEVPWLIYIGSQMAKEQRVIDFTDQLWLPNYWDLGCHGKDVLFADEIQDSNNAMIGLYRRVVGATGRFIGVGDQNQCQPPGTMVRLSDGTEIPIEQIIPGVTVVSYDRESAMFIGGSTVNEVASRPYDGYLYTVSAGGKRSKCTDSHRWLCRWNYNIENLEGHYATYLMRNGTSYRVGMTQMFHQHNGVYNSHLLARMTQEKADDMWVLGIHNNRRSALLEESITASKFGLPIATFRSTNFNDVIDDDFLDQLFTSLYPQDQRAIRCLEAFGRNIDYPFFSSGKKHKGRAGRQTLFEVQACNIIPEFMMTIVANEKYSTKDRMSINWQPIEIEKDYYKGDVYSLDISKYHKYIADGLVTCNSIMAFSGATPDAWDSMIRVFNATVMPLNICYRCPESHIELAKNFVPDLIPRPEATTGSHSTLDKTNLCSNLRPGDLVVCRFRGPLISLCLTLVLKYKVPAQIRGQDIADSIIKMIKSAMVSGNSYAPMRLFHEKWQGYIHKMLSFAKKDGDERRVADINDVDESVQQCYEAIPGAHTVEYFCEEIKKLFSPDVEEEEEKRSHVILSTIHRAKGDEADRVFILGSNLLPYIFKCDQDWQVEQEVNLSYVALTRAKQEMYFIPLHKDPIVEEEYLEDEMGGLRIILLKSKRNNNTSTIIKSANAEDHSWCKELNERLKYFGLQYNDSVWIEKEGKYGLLKDTYIIGDRRYFCVEVEGYQNWLELGRRDIQKVVS